MAGSTSAQLRRHVYGLAKGYDCHDPAQPARVGTAAVLQAGRSVRTKEVLRQ
ncbi:hypothetical protein [Kitasatospora sp. NPDC059599]|uniref:hypothetical protein n=1 Tax=Kitasatospora sp. NPDC059599 TaxID=3346880 RepID=UPI0036B458C7